MPDDTKTIGLPPRPTDDAPGDAVPDLGRARVKNLLGLVSPVANLGMVPYAPPEERWVGLGGGFILCGLAAWGWWTDTAWGWQVGLGLHYALVLLGLLHPLWPIAPAKLWVGFGKLIGLVMEWPIFGGIYYLVVTPTALLVRLFSGDPLQRKAAPEESYWQEHVPPAKERYKRQF